MQTITKTANTRWISGNTKMDVTIGGSGATFKPQVVFTKKLLDMNVSFELIGYAGGTVTELADRIQYQVGSTIFSFYPREAEELDVDDFTGKHPFLFPDSTGEEGGGFEMDIIFLNSSAVDDIQFNVTWNKANWYEQPTLSEQQLLSGEIFRQAWVEGSLAIYHPTKKNNEFKTGKFGHLYSPIHYDNQGAVTMGQMSFNQTSDTTGTLTVSKPPAQFLLAAQYPVRTDPTLGYTTIGASNQTIANSVHGSPDNLPFDAFYKKIFFHIATLTNSGSSFLGGGYDDPDLTSPAQLDLTSNTTSGGAPAGWYSATFPSGTTISKNNKWVVMTSDQDSDGVGKGGGNPRNRLSFDTAATTDGAFAAHPYDGTLPNPWNYITNGQRYSIYINYVLAQGQHLMSTRYFGLNRNPYLWS